jgi:general secretion pathway protein D
MRKCVRILGFACALALVPAGLFAAETAAERAFKAAEQAARAGDRFKAYVLYAEAARLDPANSLYSGRKLAMQNSPALVAETQISPDPGAAKAAPESIAADSAANDVTNDVAEAAAPPQLKAKEGRQNFNLKGDARVVLEGAAAALGIEIIFDPAYQPLPTVTFRAQEATFDDTLRTLERVTDSFFVPLTEKTAMVVRDTVPNRTQFAPAMAAVALIPERLSAQEAQEIVTAVQQILEIRRINTDPTRRLVIFRDSVSKATAARELFRQLSRSRAQIAVEVEIVSVSKTSSLSYGLSLPTSAAIVDFGKSAGGIANIPGNAGGFTTFYALGGGALPLGIGIANAAAFGTLSRASTQTLLSLEMVSLDGQAASFQVGSRYPVVSATFSGLTPTTTVSPTLVPSVNFVDLGIQVKLTPTVHEGGEVTLDLDASFKTLGSQGDNGIPSIDSRQYQGKVRLRSGEWAVVAGLVSVSNSETPTGVAGLSELPWIGRLFSHQNRSSDATEVLVVLKPRLLSEPPWEDISRPVWTGTESRPLSAF